MGTIGTTPPQYNQPGNLNNVPVNVTANLDASKIKQLSPAQVDAIKNLPGEKIASLNNVPINTYKNYTPQQLQNFTSNLPNANNYRKPDDKTAEAIKKRSEKQKQKAGEFEKSLDDKKGFLKDQVGQTAKSAQGVITGLLTPVLMSFVRAENIADLLIKKLTKDTKKQLQNKGTLTIENGVFTFVPNDSSNYTIFKNNFDRRVSNLKRTVSTLQNIINILNNVIKGLNIALSVIKIYIKIKQKLLLTKLARISAELAAPSPGGAKPTAGVTLFQIIRQLQQLEKDNKKVDTYQAAITAA
jgi:methyl-accepting chemotaxis protein